LGKEKTKDRDLLTGEDVVPRKANSIYIQARDREKSFCKRYGLVKLLSERLSSSGRLTVVDSPQGSDVLLEISFVKELLIPLEYNSAGMVIKHQYTVTLGAEMTEQHSGRRIFYDRTIEATIIFSQSIPPILTRYQAGEELAEELAKRLESKVLTGWYTERMTDREKGIGN
jgi:hypothetical protein